MAFRASELRQSFVEYFVKHGHTHVPSSPLIPQADPTLLFTNAGMNQFKRVFLGEEVRPYSRAVSVQKCLRAGGKHNDLENVGYTNRHHTFFEMLGNFSFGDYFKAEAIAFGWEYLTQVAQLPAERLWVTVFRDDDEAYDLWHKHIHLPTARIVRLGEKDNFWQMGDTGPCGPCSEIILDQGPAAGCGKATCAVGCECDRYLEIWNLVFMQYDRDASGLLRPLPKPSIDTGMGLERLTAVVQGVLSNYDTDLFAPLLSAIGTRSGHVYGRSSDADRSMRVIADHLRAMAFLIADGILPSNEGRGYVLRRIIRRASRHGRLLNIVEPFLFDLTSVVVEQMGTVYPELVQTAQVIAEVVHREEDRFLDTLDQGLPLLTALIMQTKDSGKAVLDGGEVFRLYDTYGFPLDLIEDAAKEAGLTIDYEGYRQALEMQRERARKASSFTIVTKASPVTQLDELVLPTQFVGYDRYEAEGMVKALVQNERMVSEAHKGEELDVVLDVTPFYPEGGGQVGDQGLLIGPAGQIEIRDTQKLASGIFLHKGRVSSGVIRVGDAVLAKVNVVTRQDAARHHTATHLVHAALRELLGPHVKQYGSLVAPHRLRFDFAHFKPLSDKELQEVEDLVNEQIQANTPVRTDVMELQEAIDAGALAFFGDKYADRVRVVEIGAFSKELCGGTHCRRTGDIGVVRIVSESGVAAGVRRLEAVAGLQALDRSRQAEAQLRELADLLKTSPSEAIGKAQKLLAMLKEREREVEQLKLKLASLGTEDGRVHVRIIDGIQVQTYRIDGLAMPELRSLSDKLRTKLRSGVLVLGSTKEDKVFLLVIVSKDLSSRIKANELAKSIAEEVGGSGGGRPEMAQAGGHRPERLDAALAKAFDFVEEKLTAQKL
ncbi:MAG: alanine--tRNA ligase [Nitrospirae bacterium]|nr:MAG: alanine--tRNA ligase [Nitrospirota bacterium]